MKLFFATCCILVLAFSFLVTPVGAAEIEKTAVAAGGVTAALSQGTWVAVCPANTRYRACTAAAGCTADSSDFPLPTEPIGYDIDIVGRVQYLSFTNACTIWRVVRSR